MTIKRILIIFIPCIVLLLGVIGVLLVQRNNNKSQNEAMPPMMTKEVSAAELAKHATATDCWTIIASSVYNLTPFFDKTPNPDLSAKVCGLDGTDALKPLSASESKTLNEKFDIYRIGLLTP